MCTYYGNLVNEEDEKEQDKDSLKPLEKLSVREAVSRQLQAFGRSLFVIKVE